MRVSSGYATPLDIQPGAPESRILIAADHASNHVPAGIELGVPRHLLNDHIAIDLGAGALSRGIAARLGGHSILGHVSRLVIDLNRELEAAALIPESSDGHEIPGNIGLVQAERERRLATLHGPYHDAITEMIDHEHIEFIVSVHSFTPALASRAEARPWPVGILYNGDDRAAAVAIALLRARGINVGDNQPYSGRVLNYTMNRHAEARGLPYVGFEVRQDELATPESIARWSILLSEIVAETRAQL